MLPQDSLAEDADNPGVFTKLTEGFDYTVRSLLFYTSQNPASSDQNPDNRFLQLPDNSLTLDLRPDFTVNTEKLFLQFKPRFHLIHTHWDVEKPATEEEWVNSWLISEMSARFLVRENLFFILGRENLQWGPSFLLSPSNPFFWDNGRKNPKIEVAGMDFARVVWLPLPSWTLSLMANVGKGEQEFPLSPFRNTYALKLDYSGIESYAGCILSHQEGNHPRIGGFAGLTVSDALLLYGEGSLSQGSNAFYPATDSSLSMGTMEMTEDDSKNLGGIILLGTSYTMEAGPTLTAEYVYNNSGYDHGEAEDYYRIRHIAGKNLFASGASGGLARQTLGRTANPGLQLLRRNYLMAQYVHNDIWDLLNVTLRWTGNIDDDSTQFTSIFEYFWGDHLQLFSVATVNRGSDDTEFGSFLEYQWVAGFEITF